jgi:signal transduction histidine kinase
MTTRSKLIAALVLSQVGLLVVASLVAHGFALAAISDLVQLSLLLTGTLCFFNNASTAKGRTRLFWAFLSSGMACWLFYQVLWAYYEVLLRHDVPDLFWGDMVLFLHIVPMIAAVAIQPNIEHEQRTSKLGTLDFALLFVWWLYLYAWTVLPWQYVTQNVTAYNHNFNVIYATEKLALLTAISIVYLRSSGGWKKIYRSLFGASATYALSSYVANWAIGRNVYYSGSLYDVPLVASMAWMTLIGVSSHESDLQRDTSSVVNNHGVWVARLGMTAIFSLPIFAIWSRYHHSNPPEIRNFRLTLTLACMLVMGAMVFVRQYLLDKELVTLLHLSQDSFENLRNLQTQLVESEKLSSLGQLVAGAAHELNNPLTAMLGYSDLLTEACTNQEQRAVAEKIGHQVRNTRSLIASLISFAKQSPGERSMVDLGALAQTAVNLARPQIEAQHVTIKIDRSQDLHPIMGDSNQLLHVCSHLVNSGLNLLGEAGGCLNIRIFRKGDFAVLELSDQARQLSRRGDSDPSNWAGTSQPTAGLGITACMGIVQNHRGAMMCKSNPDGSAVVRIELPFAYSNSGQLSEVRRSIAQAR